MGRVVISVCVEPDVYEAVRALRAYGFNVSVVCNNALRWAVETYAPDPKMDEATKKAVERAVEIARKQKEEAEKIRIVEEAEKAKQFDGFLNMLETRREFVRDRMKSWDKEKFLAIWAKTTGKTREELLELISKKVG